MRGRTHLDNDRWACGWNDHATDTSRRHIRSGRGPDHEGDEARKSIARHGCRLIPGASYGFWQTQSTLSQSVHRRGCVARAKSSRGRTETSAHSDGSSSLSADAPLAGSPASDVGGEGARILLACNRVPSNRTFGAVEPPSATHVHLDQARVSARCPAVACDPTKP
jgi:hypothetical protein